MTETDLVTWQETVTGLKYLLGFIVFGSLIFMFFESLFVKAWSVTGWILSKIGKTIGFFFGIFFSFFLLCYGFYFLVTLLF